MDKGLYRNRVTTALRLAFMEPVPCPIQIKSRICIKQSLIHSTVKNGRRLHLFQFDARNRPLIFSQ
jgi:hypothetical protein